MSVGVGNYTAHAHLRRALDQAVGDKTVRVGDGDERSGDGEDAVMNARHDLANASADTSLVAKVGDVLAGLADDDTGFLGGDNGAKSELSLVVLFLGARVLGAVGVEARELVGHVVDAAVDGRGLNILGRHGWS